MTRSTNTLTQGLKTGLTTPVRGTSNDPVTSGSPDSFLEVQAPTDLDDALPTKHHPIVVETVDEEDEEDKEAKERKEADIASLSDLDEALSDGASSYGDEPVFAGSPNLQDLVRLGQEHCRSPCNSKNKDGVKTASVCGKTVVECGRHAETRLGQGKSGKESTAMPSEPTRRSWCPVVSQAMAWPHPKDFSLPTRSCTMLVGRALDTARERGR
jgi:hypothetical protein